MSHKSSEALIAALKTQWAWWRTQPPRALYQICIDAEFDRPLSSLLSVPSTRKLYWQGRGREIEITGLGVAVEFTASRAQDIPDLWRDMKALDKPGGTPIRFFGGMAFDPHQALDAVWSPMGLMRFWVPQVGLHRQGDDLHWVFSTPSLEDDALAGMVQCVTSALKPQTQGRFSVPKSQGCDIQPDEGQWMRRVETMTQTLAQAQGKLVLSARRSHRLTEPLNLCQLFGEMQSRSQGGFQYYFQVEDQAFMGVSPECLYERQATSLATEALAGTARQDGHGLDTPKENCEHDFVVRDMTEALAEVCTDVICQPGKERLKWQDLVHLKTALAGTLKSGVTDAQIIQVLHPSAAVLGYPRHQAWQWLRACEDHVRGWYAAPVGWFERDRAQFAVAIRCAMVTSRDVHLYAGAGLVGASRPAEEWQEVQDKMQFFREILGG